MTGDDWDVSSCIGSMWSHMQSRAERETEWEEKWHASQPMMDQFLACYKRRQLADKEREKEEQAEKGKGGGPGSSADASIPEAEAEPDMQGFTPPQNLVQQAAGRAATWATRSGWGGSATPRF